MKIVVVSNYYWMFSRKNYGTLFQAFALQHYLKKAGHDASLLKEGPSFRWGGLYFALRYFIGHALIRLRLLPDAGESARRKYEKKHPRKFEDFVKKYISVTPGSFNRHTIKKHYPKADAYIAGSDQVWGLESDLKFLNFAHNTNVLKTAYAASCPWNTRSKEWIEYARGALKDFTAISVREPEGVEVCARAGYDSVSWVSDPTLLLPKDEYMRLVRNENDDVPFEKPFIFLYLVNVYDAKEIDLSALERKFGKTHEIKIVAIQGGETANFPDKYMAAPTPTQWLNLFDKAEYVITNSYHGTMFSIIFKKQFAVLLQDRETEAENCRFISVLAKGGLKNRIGGGFDKIDGLLAEPINWVEVDKNLGEFISESKGFLDKSLRS